MSTYVERAGLCASFFFFLVFILTPARGFGEWYTGAYGGMSLSGAIRSVTMPQYGQQLALQQFPGARPEIGRATLTQTFKASDVAFESSEIFGAKAGYFFSEKNLPWLGVEIEAFTSKPTIKAQTLSTQHDIFYTPNAPGEPCTIPGNCPEARSTKGTLALTESPLRVSTVAFNVIARYPGEVLQPYVGIGAGAFYFHSSSGTIQGRQWAPGLNALAGLKFLVADEWGLFVEGKYNMANLSNFDPTYGLSGTYSMFHVVGGIAYHF